MSESELVEIIEPDGPRKVIIEDDGRTGYVYLLVDDKFVADVWLYNVTPPSECPAWDDPRDLPFQNRPELIADVAIARIDQQTDVTCVWNASGVEIFVGGRLTARLHPGDKPGQSLGVLVDGPLGRRLE